MLDWANIKERIYVNVSKTLIGGTPAYSEQQIREAIDYFQSFLSFRSGYSSLDGLPKYLLPSLQDALIDKKGELSPLTNISTNIEPFVKKILVSIFGETWNNIKDIGLAQVLKKININLALSSQIKKMIILN